MMKRDADKCKTCDNTRLWHENNDARHVFNDGSVPFKSTFGDRNRKDRPNQPQRGSESPSMMPWPFDPVLRQALIDKNILTPDDLRNAEAKIREMSILFGQGGFTDGQREGR